MEKTMKQILTTAICLLLLSCSNNNKKTELKTENDSVSYSIGVDIGTTLARQGIAVEPEAFAQGIKDAADTSGVRLMSEEQVHATLMAFQQKMIEKAEQKMQEQSGKAIMEGEKFLAENKTKPGVITTASGLQYKVVTMGKGKKPKASSEVLVHYRGKLLDGTEFDNSYTRDEPVSFPVNGVIAGWTEALQLMPEGSKWQLFIPANLGYGNRSAGPIPPGSTLIFDVELLKIKK